MTQTTSVSWSASHANQTASYAAMTGIYGTDWGIMFGLSVTDSLGPVAPSIIGTPTATSAVISCGTDENISAKCVLLLVDFT